MEAVFTKDIRISFSSPSTPKTFYHPTASKVTGKKTQPPRTGTRATLNKAHLQKPDTLMTFPPSILTSPSPHNSVPVWDLRQSSSPQGGGADQSSEGSSKFNESWPSTSEQGGVASGVRVEPGASGGEEMECDLTRAAANESTLARYIDRFRHAPPTSRGSRGDPSDAFWWRKGEAKEKGVMDTLPVAPVDTSTPTNSREKSHTHTDPSPRVSEETSLDSRSQDLLEKCSSLLTSSSFVESPPAQKYLNTLRVREDPPQSASPEATCRGVARGSGFRQGQQDTEDILVQWRLRRKLEQARNESSKHNLQITSRPPELRSGSGIQVEPHPPGPESERNSKVESSQDFHPATDTVKESAGTSVHHQCPCLATPPHAMCCAGAVCCHHLHHLTATPTSVASSELRHVPLQDTCRGGGARQQEVKEQEVQTSPDLLDRKQVEDPHEEGHAGEHTLNPAIAVRAPPTTTHTDHKTTSYHPSHSDRESLTPSPTPNSTPLLSRASKLGPQSRESLPSPGATPPPSSRTPPTHGGLALRDISDEDEDTVFTMTFDTEVDMSRANTALGSHPTTLMDTPKHHLTATPVGLQKTRMSASNLQTSHMPHMLHVSTPHRHESNEELLPATPPPPLLTPSPIGVVGTSEEPTTPPQKVSDSLSGFPWDEDMGDDLLKLLISKARLFEGQIREIDCRLMALQEEQQ